MNLMEIGQKLLEKTTRMTLPKRRPELKKAFLAAGFGVSPDGARVMRAPKSVEAFDVLYEKLDALPTAKMAAKRLLGSYDIYV